MATKDTITGLKAKTFTVSGPASYTTGGIEVTADTDFSWIMAIEPEVVTRGSLPACDFEIDLNVSRAGAESMGNGVIKIVRAMYDKATFTNATPTSLPSGVVAQASKFAAGTTTGSAHTHTMNHDHPSFETAGGLHGGLNATTDAAGVPLATHTHTVDIANFTGSTTSTTHAHERSFEYEHSHDRTEATADFAATELANATDISTTSFKVTCYGFGKQ